MNGGKSTVDALVFYPLLNKTEEKAGVVVVTQGQLILNFKHTWHSFRYKSHIVRSKSIGVKVLVCSVAGWAFVFTVKLVPITQHHICRMATLFTCLQDLCGLLLLW